MNLEPHVAGDGARFGDSFWSPAETQRRGGVIVASTISRGISPTGVSGRVTYVGTESLLINATQMTLEMRFRAGTARAVLCPLVAKCNTTVVDNQFIFLVSTLNNPIFYVPTSAADFATYVTANAVLVAGSEYVMHAVFNGAAAPGSRAILYRNGLVDPSVTTGAIPSLMRAGQAPLTALNYAAGSTAAPSNDYLLRSFTLSDFAMDAGACWDRYAYLMAKELTP